MTEPQLKTKINHFKNNKLIFQSFLNSWKGQPRILHIILSNLDRTFPSQIAISCLITRWLLISVSYHYTNISGGLEELGLTSQNFLWLTNWSNPFLSSIWSVWPTSSNVTLRTHALVLQSKTVFAFWHFWNCNGYFTIYWTNTRHVCTYFNAFLIVIPNIDTKFQNFDILWNFVKFLFVVCSRLSRGKG